MSRFSRKFISCILLVLSCYLFVSLICCYSNDKFRSLSSSSSFDYLPSNSSDDSLVVSLSSNRVLQNVASNDDQSDNETVKERNYNEDGMENFDHATESDIEWNDLDDNPSTELESTTPIVVPDDERSILFVHVGKAGGETIKEAFEHCCSIRKNVARKNNCYANLPNSTLSDIVKGYVHGIGPTIPSDIRENVTSILINLRNPIDRIISWYGFVNPHHCNQGTSGTTNCIVKRHVLNHLQEDYLINKLYMTCFPTIEDFAIGTNPKAKRTSDECKVLARIIVEGGEYWGNRRLSYPFYAHAKANYRYYYTQFIQEYWNEKEILVIRTNHMWDDMVSLEQYVGGSSTFDTLVGTHYSHGSEKYKQISMLSNSSTTTTTSTNSKTGVIPLPAGALKSLCCAMINEIILYRSILYKASNLNDEQKQSTFQEDLQRCNYDDFDTMLLECSTIPRLTEEIEITVAPPRTPNGGSASIKNNATTGSDTTTTRRVMPTRLISLTDLLSERNRQRLNITSATTRVRRNL